MTADIDSVEPGAPGPEFSLESHEGGKVRLADFRGRNIVLYFMREFT